jgi:hypothetical protein
MQFSKRKKASLQHIVTYFQLSYYQTTYFFHSPYYQTGQFVIITELLSDILAVMRYGVVG